MYPNSPDGIKSVPAIGCDIPTVLDPRFIQMIQSGRPIDTDPMVLRGSIGYHVATFADKRGLILSIEIDGVMQICLPASLIQEALRLHRQQGDHRVN